MLHGMYIHISLYLSYRYACTFSVHRSTIGTTAKSGRRMASHSYAAPLATSRNVSLSVWILLRETRLWQQRLAPLCMPSMLDDYRTNAHRSCAVFRQPLCYVGAGSRNCRTSDIRTQGSELLETSCHHQHIGLFVCARCIPCTLDSLGNTMLGSGRVSVLRVFGPGLRRGPGSGLRPGLGLGLGLRVGLTWHILNQHINDQPVRGSSS
jgi:hypothetical protein